MKWLTNIYNPQNQDAIFKIEHSIDETPEDAMKKLKLWLSDKIISIPFASKKYTSRELAAMGMIGVYKKD